MATSFLAYFGHINIDISIRVPVLPRIGSVNVTSVTENFGGTAGNFAIVSRVLGLDFDLYSAVSPKTHDAYMEYLSGLGICLEHVESVAESYGPVCYISSDGSDQVAYVYQGPMDTWSPVLNFPRNSTYKWAHFSTGPPEEYAKLFDLLDGSLVTFDPGQEIHYRYGRDIALKFIERADMFVGNDAEYEKLIELTGNSEGDLASMIRTIIVTRGKNGVTVFQEGRRKDLSILQARSVYDTIGAGDSFRAGLYYGLWKGMDTLESVAMGIVVSSKAIEAPLTEFGMSGLSAEKNLKENIRNIIGE